MSNFRQYSHLAKLCAGRSHQLTLDASDVVGWSVELWRRLFGDEPPFRRLKNMIHQNKKFLRHRRKDSRDPSRNRSLIKVWRTRRQLATPDGFCGHEEQTRAECESKVVVISENSHFSSGLKMLCRVLNTLGVGSTWGVHAAGSWTSSGRTSWESFAVSYPRASRAAWWRRSTAAWGRFRWPNCHCCCSLRSYPQHSSCIFQLDDLTDWSRFARRSADHFHLTTHGVWLRSFLFFLFLKYLNGFSPISNPYLVSNGVRETCNQKTCQKWSKTTL